MDTQTTQPHHRPSMTAHRAADRHAESDALLAFVPGALPVRREDRALFERALRGVSGSTRPSISAPISDMSFVASHCWSEALSLAWTEIDGHLCLFSAADGDLSMMLPPHAIDPAATDRLGDVVSACFEIMDAGNAEGPGTPRSRIEYVSDEMLDLIRASGAPALSATPMPGDYVYRREALVELAGGDLKNKRKLRSKFLRENPEVSTGDITPDDIPECVELLGLWRSSSDERHEGEANDRLIGVDVLRERDERCTKRYLEMIDELELPSMLVRAGGKLVGFTIGEFLTPSMAVVAVEKTHPDFDGTPQFIYSEFCRTRLESAGEINAGDDWGIDALRFTKTSYRPSRMLSKTLLARNPISEMGTPEPATVRLLRWGRPAPSRNPALSTPIPAEVRPATLADADAILAIEEAAFESPADRFKPQQIRRLIENPRARVAVAVRDGAVVGWTVALIRTHRRWRSGRVYSVAVRPESAGTGVGRALIGALLATLGDEGITRVYLEVRATNAGAIALYTSVGFKPIRTLEAYYTNADGTETDGVRMLRVAPG
jgi:ribosomal protein S18 acetylase RimI-like enzyme